MSEVRFTLPYVPEASLRACDDSLISGHLAGDGPFSQQVSSTLATLHQAEAALLTPSGTHALELAMWLLELEAGDEVIVPSYTFSSTANAVIQAGGVPVFVDIEPVTCNISPTAVEAAITDRTRAVVPIHYAGISADMGSLLRISKEREIQIIEDNAHGFGGFHHQVPLGSIGRFSALSFHETKNVQCGEGGALIVKDKSDVDRAQILREKGTNRTQFFHGQVDKYTWVDRGSSWLLAEPLAAVLHGQLANLDALQQSRKHVWCTYQDALSDWADALEVQQPFVPEYAQPSWHIYYLIFKEPSTRERFIAHMRTAGIMTVFHYVPLHSSQAGMAFGTAHDEFPVTDYVSQGLVRLPLWTMMPDSVINQVVDAILKFR